MLQANDVLKIGPYTYRVIKTKGNMVLFTWVTSKGISCELWVMVKKTPQLKVAA